MIETRRTKCQLKYNSLLENNNAARRNGGRYKEKRKNVQRLNINNGLIFFEVNYAAYINRTAFLGDKNYVRAKSTETPTAYVNYEINRFSTCSRKRRTVSIR